MLTLDQLQSKYPNRCKDQICALCGRKQDNTGYNDPFYGISCDQVDPLINQDAPEGYYRSHFGYICAYCYFVKTGKDYRNKSIGQLLHELNEKRRNQ